MQSRPRRAQPAEYLIDPREVLSSRRNWSMKSRLIVIFGDSRFQTASTPDSPETSFAAIRTTH
jgi:hypothetical protein